MYKLLVSLPAYLLALSVNFQKPRVPLSFMSKFPADWSGLIFVLRLVVAEEKFVLNSTQTAMAIYCSQPWFPFLGTMVGYS